MKKDLTRRQDLSVLVPDFAYKTFFGVGSFDIQGSNPEESLIKLSRRQDLSVVSVIVPDFAYKPFFGVVSIRGRGAPAHEGGKQIFHGEG